MLLNIGIIIEVAKIIITTNLQFHRNRFLYFKSNKFVPNIFKADTGFSNVPIDQPIVKVTANKIGLKWMTAGSTELASMETDTI